MQFKRPVLAMILTSLAWLMLSDLPGPSSVSAQVPVTPDSEQASQSTSAEATSANATTAEAAAAEATIAEAEGKDQPQSVEQAGENDETATIQGTDDAISEVSKPDLMAALQAGPRALSLAFRMAAKQATGSVVVVYTYGQNPDGTGGKTGEENSGNQPSQDPLPLLERAEIPSPPATTTDKLTGIGSGVILTADGLIITNNHVIRNATRVVIQLPDETQVDADVIRGDPDSDVAIVRITPPSPLLAIGVGDSDKLEIGDWVLAIGSPFKLEATVSAGIISGKDRRLDRIRRSSMLQTDAAINPGNSGGALIDLDGNVIGISTAIATRSGFYQGVGFAIPINQARWIADELDRHGKVRRAAIGTTLVELKPRIAKKFDLKPYSGVLIYQVIKDSVAEKAGLKPLDVIVEFAGLRVSDSTSLQEAIEQKPIGSKQPIVVSRGGKRIQLSVELATADNPTGEE